MKESIYIESSIISYYTSRPSRDLIIAGRQEITHEKWPRILKEFDSYVSVLVRQEIEQGDQDIAQKRLESISELCFLKINEDAERLAALLIQKKAIPETSLEDALHIAIAAVHGMNYILTWNFTHINNAQIKSKIISVVEDYGYCCPVICSPEELLGEDQ